MNRSIKYLISSYAMLIAFGSTRIVYAHPGEKIIGDYPTTEKLQQKDKAAPMSGGYALVSVKGLKTQAKLIELAGLSTITDLKEKARDAFGLNAAHTRLLKLSSDHKKFVILDDEQSLRELNGFNGWRFFIESF